MYLNSLSRSRMSRMARSLFRHPVRNRDYPEKSERLITADELVRLGI